MARTGRNVGVLVTDTAGRAWREGQTDIAIGAAGLRVLVDLAGSVDAHGNELAVTAPAVADELAGAAELTQGKLAARPLALVRGRDDLVLPPGEHGTGAAALVRPDGADLFGYGAREAVVRALRGDEEDRAAFGSPADPNELTDAIRTVLPGATVRTEGGAVVVLGGDARTLAGLAFAFGWRPDDAPDGRRSAVPTHHSVDSALDRPPSTSVDHTEEPNSWPRPPRPTARRRSTRSATSRRAPSVGAAS